MQHVQSRFFHRYRSRLRLFLLSKPPYVPEAQPRESQPAKSAAAFDPPPVLQIALQFLEYLFLTARRFAVRTDLHTLKFVIKEEALSEQ